MAFARTGKNLPVVVYDNSDKALGLSENKKHFTETLEKLNIPSHHFFDSTVSSGDLVPSIEALAEQSSPLPACVAREKTGLYAVAHTKQDADRLIECIRTDTPCTHTESGSFREGRLGGCIAAITGGAQGFGKGIAEELAREGAYVVIGDIKDEIGNETVGEITSRFGEGSAAFCHVDVTDLASLEEFAACAAKLYGGLDLFVSNAGVLKAGPVDEMDERSFDLVTSVNYKAYFLGTKAVAPIMKIQNSFHAGHFMDIIQISSKSGLVGSNKNFAYAGSKFGGIGLTQSFALELIDSNIRVNSICPGNYYEGPLWSDPERGLFVQYLNAGKVPGAKTIDDVKQFYMSKVPMGRGCTPLDVARAIFYVHEQEYETGQAIPVTGGQVMLS
ncbi:MAG: SDR family NAD(P)-dependent oxidoreductase [Chitinivibrionales bacterium]|nr:SDR family NAD(P)-dependent oxidoreductase [Chitinivibrionales bacterium]